MARLTHLLTVSTRDGSPLDLVWPFERGQSSTVLGIYGEKDLADRLTAAKDRPDLVVTYRKATDADRNPQ